jgi:acyl dehydratase
LNFVNPTIVDDAVTVTGKVISKSESTKIIELKTTIKNSSHVLVDGKAKVILSK